MKVQFCSSKCVLSRPTDKTFHSLKCSKTARGAALVGCEAKERGSFHGSGRSRYIEL